MARVAGHTLWPTGKHAVAVRHEWRCERCGRLLGILEEGRLHIKFSRGGEYLVSFPVTAVCPACHTLNEIRHRPDIASCRDAAAEG